mgnify:CR=1 FL=1
MSSTINVHNNFNMIDAVTGGKLTYEGGIEIGSNTTTSSVGTGIAFGKGAMVTADNALAIGSNSTASVSGAVALGQNITADQTDGIFMKHRSLSSESVTLAGFRSGSNELISGSDNTTVTGNVQFLGNVQLSGDVVLDGNVFGLPDSVGSFSAGTTGLTPSSPTTGDIVLAGTLNTANGGTGLTAIGTSDQILGVNNAGNALEYKSDLSLSSATFSGNVDADNVNATNLITATDATLSGDLTAVNTTLSGDLGAVGGTFSGNVDADNVNATNLITATDVTLSGDLTAVNTTLSGDLAAVDGTFSGDVCVSGNIQTDTIQPKTTGGNVTVSGNLVVTEKTYLGDVCMDGNLSGNNNIVLGVEDLISVCDVVEDWVQRGLDIDGEAAGDESGYSVSLSADGTTVAIGARKNDGNGGDSGHTRIFDYVGTGWVQRGSDIDGEAAGDRSGSVSLSADGNRVAIGAQLNDANGTYSGHTRIFDYVGTDWVQRGSDIDGEAAGDQSGQSVSLSADGSTVAIGAPKNDGNGANSGHTRVFGYDGTDWVQRGSDIDGEASNDFSSENGVSLSEDGSVLAIGAFLNDGTAYSSGHTRIFDYVGTDWVQRGSDIDGEAYGDLSGHGVSLSYDGNTVAIGAYYNSGNGFYSGHARIFDYVGTDWVQRGSDIDGEAAGDESGYSVSLSSDGNTVAIGAPFNDGNGSNSGHTRIFDYVGTDWVQRGSDIDGEAAGDTSGFMGCRVSLSADGSTVAIGALNNDGNGANSGHTRVVRFETVCVDGVDFLCSNISNVNAIYVDTVYSKNGVDDVTVENGLIITGSLTASSSLSVSGLTTLTTANISGSATVYGNTQFFDDVNFYGNVFGLPDSVGSFSAGTTGLTPSSPTTGDIVLAGTLNTANGGTGLSAIGTSDQILGVNSGGSALEYKSDLNLSGGATFGGDLVVGGNIMAEFINIQGNCIFSNDLTSSVCVFDGGAVTVGGTTLTVSNTTTIEGNLTLDQQLLFTDGIVVGNVDSTSSSTTGVAIGKNASVSSSGAIALGENIVANQVNGFFVKHRNAVTPTAAYVGAYDSASNEIVGLPFAGGAGYLLTSDAAGALAWAAPTVTGVTTFQTSLNGLTPSTSTSGAVTLAGTLGEVSGGTGQTTYTTGDMLYSSASNTLSKLAVGSVGQVLTLAGGVPTWAATAVTGVSTFQTSLDGLTPSTSTSGAVTLAGTLGEVSGGTGQTTYTTGDILVSSASNTLSKLAIGTSDQLLGVNSGGSALEYKSSLNLSGGATFGGDLVVGGNIMAEFINIQGNCLFSNDLSASVCLYDGGAVTIDGTTLTVGSATTIEGNLTLDQQLLFSNGIVVGNVDTTSSSTTGVAIGNNASVSSNGAVALGENIVANQVNGLFVKHRGPIAATINMAGFIAGTNELVEITSSRRFKENIRDLEDVSVKFDQLRPVRYNPKEGHGDTREHIGLIAEEVQKVFPEFVTYDVNTGETTGLMFDRMVSVLIQEIQSLKSRDVEKDAIIQQLREKCGI